MNRHRLAAHAASLSPVEAEVERAYAGALDFFGVTAMAKTSGPLLSMGASGQIGQSHVYASWKGVKYARRHVVPGNPQTTDQMLTRNVFSGLNSIFKLAPALVADVWSAFASGKPLTDRNAFIKENLANMRSEIDMLAFTFSGGARGGLPLVSATFTPGANKITVAGVTPTPPTGWVVTSVIGACIRDQDPHVMEFPVTTAGEDLATPYSFDLTGLTTAELYVCGAWIKWAKPDGSVAYSPATMGSATPT